MQTGCFSGRLAVSMGSHSHGASHEWHPVEVTFESLTKVSGVDNSNCLGRNQSRRSTRAVVLAGDYLRSTAAMAGQLTLTPGQCRSAWVGQLSIATGRWDLALTRSPCPLNWTAFRSAPVLQVYPGRGLWLAADAQRFIPLLIDPAHGCTGENVAAWWPLEPVASLANSSAEAAARPGAKKTKTIGS